MTRPMHGIVMEMQCEIDTLTETVAALTAERDTLASRWAAVVEHQRIMLGFAMLSDDEDVCQTMAHANQNYSAMEAERDAARAALTDVLLLTMRLRHKGTMVRHDADTLLRFCADGGITPSPLREVTSATALPGDGAGAR